MTTGNDNSRNALNTRQRPSPNSTP